MSHDSHDKVIDIPPGARPASRVLVISDDSALLLLKGKEINDDHWWVSPGGGLAPGESFETAAARELLEETGFTSPIGPCVWTRHHRYEWFGKPHNQFECFFVTRVGGRAEPRALKTDGYIVGHRWWTVEAIQASSDRFSPRSLAAHLPPILRGEYPPKPFDSGV